MAETIVGDLVARLRLDNSEFSKGVKSAEKDTQTFAQRMDSLGGSMKNFGDEAVGFGKKMSTNVTLPIVALGVLSIKAASDLDESQNKVRVVFGDSAKGIEKWAADSARGFGLSKAAAYEAVGTFGNLFRAMDVSTPAAAKMSKQLVVLAADLASFNNANPADVLLALRSGLVGEAEPLRKFGVSLSAARIETEALKMGLAATKDELTAGMKAQAAYSIIMLDTALAQGDFARTSGGLANQMRILKAEVTNAAAELGTVLIPIGTKAIGVFAAMATAIAGAPEGLKKTAIALGSVLAVIGPSAFVIGKLAQGIAMLITGYLGLASAAQSAAIAALYAKDALIALASNPQVLALLAVSAAVVAVGIALRSTNEEWAKAETRGIKAGVAMAEAARVSGNEIVTLKSGVRDLAAEIQRRNAVEALSMEQTIEYKARLEVLTGALGRAKEVQREAKLQDQERAVALGHVADGTKDMTTATDDAVSAMQALQSQVLAMSGGAIGLQQANLNATKAQEDFNAAVKEYGPFSREAYEADLKAQQAKLAATGAALSYDDAMNTLKRTILSTPEAYDAEIVKLRESMALHPENAAGIQEEIDKLIWLKASLESIPAHKRINLEITQFLAGLNPMDPFGIYGTVPGRAVGGPVMGGTPYMVGERGPELFVPGASGSIVPNHALGGGGSTTVNLILDGQIIEQVVIDGINRRATRGPGPLLASSVA